MCTSMIGMFEYIPSTIAVTLIKCSVFFSFYSNNDPVILSPP